MSASTGELRGIGFSLCGLKFC